MENNRYNEVLAGYKKSLQALKSLDKETYNMLIRNLQKFSREEIEDFFENMKQDISTDKTGIGVKRKLNITRKQTIKSEIVNISETNINYDESFGLCVESFSKGMADRYNLFRLCPLVDNLQNFTEGEGTIFFERTVKDSIKDSCKQYYAIKKVKDGYELFVQDSSGNLLSGQKLKSLPTGKGYDLVR